MQLDLKYGDKLHYSRERLSLSGRQTPQFVGSHSKNCIALEAYETDILWGGGEEAIMESI